ncbi:MAG: histidine phosphatase family protein, partial [archaeon]|nr:histidine phosphatase family protein [archaeon]
GQTDFNVQKRYQGLSQTPLNENGLRQAKKIAEILKNEDFDAAFSSPLKRAVQTAKEIVKPHKNLKLILREELRELDYGHLSGKTPNEIEIENPGTWAKREKNKYDFDHLGGETFRDADEKRVKPLLKEFQEKYSSRTILAVSHGGLGRLIIGNLLGLEPKEKMIIDIPNDCIYYINYRPHKTEVNYFLVDSKKEGNGYLIREDWIV